MLAKLPKLFNLSKISKLSIFKPKLKIKSAAWDAAGSGRRFARWNTDNSSINSLLDESLDVLRNRSRDVVRNNPYANNILETLTSNCIGTGIKPQSKASDPELRKQLQILWLKWTDSADARGVSDFYGLQSLIFRSMIENGECFVKFCIKHNSKQYNNKHLQVPLQLQVIESDLLDSGINKILPNGNVIRGGIETDELGNKLAYYMFRYHPGDKNLMGSQESIRIPAEDILHIYKPTRPGQLRGEPWLTNILTKLSIVHPKVKPFFLIDPTTSALTSKIY